MEKFFFYIRPFFNSNKMTTFFFKSHSKFVLAFNVNIKNFTFRNSYYISKKFFFFNFVIFKEKRNFLKGFLNIFYRYIKGINQGFYVKFKVIGLGFKVRRVFFKNMERFLKINLGFSHNIFYKIPKTINIFIKKRILFLQASDFNILMCLTKRLQMLRISNPYKEKGILLFNKVVKLKSGKQQQK